MKKLLTPLLLCILGIVFIHSADVQADISENVLRLHIIANSNSASDQKIKFTVRDEILSGVNSLPTLSKLEAQANDLLLRKSVPYKASVTTERCYVPEKEYKNIKLPEGIYDCVKVVLGDGKGENWWCVAYPPLCFTEDMFGEMSESAQKLLSESLDRETLDTIIKNENINFRFKILETVQKLRFM